MGDGVDFMRYGSDYVNKKNIFRIAICFPILLVCAVIVNSIQFPPLFEIKRFYIPALDKSLNSSKNASITFDIALTNGYAGSKIYCDPINVTFYDSPSQNHSIANFTIPEFNLKEGISTVDYGAGMVNATGFDLDGAKREISAHGFKVFRVGLETSVRYDYYLFWKTKRYGYRKGVDVKVGDTGAAAKFGNNFVGIRALVMFNFMVLVFLRSY